VHPLIDFFLHNSLYSYLHQNYQNKNLINI
jgi:hypothetical protein